MSALSAGFESSFRQARKRAPGCPGALKPTNSLKWVCLLRAGSSVSWLGCSFGSGLLVVCLLGLLGCSGLSSISRSGHGGCCGRGRGSGRCGCWLGCGSGGRGLGERCNGNAGQNGSGDQGLDIQHGLKLTHFQQSHKLRPSRAARRLHRACYYNAGFLRVVDANSKKVFTAASGRTR